MSDVHVVKHSPQVPGTPGTPPPGPPGKTSLFRSLEVRLPLMAGLMLVVTVAALVTASYIAVRRTTILGASARLLGSAQQVAALLKSSGDSLVAVTRRVGQAPEVRAYFQAPTPTPSRRLITVLQGVTQPDRLVAVELRDTAGRHLLNWGPSAAAVDTMRVGEIERLVARGSVAPAAPAPGGPASDAPAPGSPATGTVGSFRAIGDTIIYPVAAAVLDGGRRVGTVIHWRRQASNPNSRDQLANLFGGPGTTLLLGDTTGQAWTDLVGRVPAPPDTVVPGAPAIEYTRAGQGRRFAVAAQGEGTPWVTVIDVPFGRVIEPAESFLRLISGIALAFLALAAFGTWLISRSITRPLARLATAADAFNAGDLAERVTLRRDDEFGHVAAAFNRMADGIQGSIEALKEADRKKDEFLATLAHELRNPLAPIMNGVYALRAMDPEPDERTGRLYSVINRQLAVVTRLVDDLLEISRITRGTVELRKEAVDLATVVEQALEGARPILENTGHHLAVDVDRSLAVRGDPVRLSQILLNLLSNSAKYTPPGGHITLTVRREADSAVISVKDDGEGISRENLDRIFEMFVQVKARGTGSTGLGVGLTLVRKLTDLHGGTVSARSEGPGRGSEFIVRLPLTDETPRPVEPARRPSRQIGRGVHALVVDDNKDAAEMFAGMLRSMDVIATVLHDGQTALEAIAADDPQIVFLDIGMPGMDGFEVARRIRAEHDSRVALVAVTGWGAEDDRKRSAEAGFDYHLVKPVDAEKLRALLASWRAL